MSRRSRISQTCLSGALIVLLAGSLAAQPSWLAGQGETPAVHGSEYLSRLGVQDRARQGDLLRLVGRFVGASAARAGALETLVEELRHKKILDPGFRPHPDRRVERGDAALLFARALALDCGVTGRLFGRGRRAAYRDLVDKRVMVAGGDGFEMSGAELIGVLERAREYRKKRAR